MNRLQRRSAWPAPWRLAGAALSGVLAAQAFPAMDLTVLAWLAICPLLVALRGVTPGQGAWLGMIQGSVFFALLLAWIPGVMARYGGLSWLLALPIGILLVMVLALFHASFGAVQAWICRRLGLAGMITAAPLWVILCEWMRLWPLGGFPWGLLGYTAYRTPAVLQLASLGGVFGLSLLMVATSAALAAAAGAAQGRNRGALLLLAAALPTAAWGGGRGLLWEQGEPESAERIQVAAIQGNVPQDEKWQEEHRAEILARHLDLTLRAAAGGADVVFWPESSTLEQIESSHLLRQRLQHLADRHGSYLVLGSLHATDTGTYTNSAFLLAPGEGLVDRYDKVKLVPFGETVPLRRLLFFAAPLVQAVGEFSPGTESRPLGAGLHLAGPEAGPTPLGMAICYEIIYPHLTAAQVRRGATVLTTITNDAWFGRSWAPHQHFAMAVFRAAETRRWLVRAANTGISCLVSPRGEVVAATRLFELALVQGEVEPRRGLSLAVQYPQAVPLACVIFTGGVLFWALLRPTNTVPGLRRT